MSKPKAPTAEDMALLARLRPVSGPNRGRASECFNRLVAAGYLRIVWNSMKYYSYVRTPAGDAALSALASK